MTTLELQTEYQSLVSRIANEDYETISKAVKEENIVSQQGCVSQQDKD